MIFPWNEALAANLLKRKDRLPHALLLRGPQGIGKLALAEMLAQALLCEKPASNGSACGQCVACGWSGQGGHPDFRRLEPEALAGPRDEEERSEKKKPSEEIKIEQVREIEDFIQVTSHRGGAKIVLIHPAEALNPNAANALLKNLEEPPRGMYFLLVAHRWHQLLPTLKSRCQQVPLSRPPVEAARGWLKEQGVHDPELALAQTGGAPLLAAKLDEEYWTQREQFLKGLSGKNLDALALAERIRDLAPALVVGWLQKWGYDLVLHKTTGSVRYNPDQAAAIATVSGRLDLVEAVRFQRHVVRLQRIVSHPLNTRLFFEEILLRYASLLRGRSLARAA
jgi:DNA polymerase III subunit delta'